MSDVQRAVEENNHQIMSNQSISLTSSLSFVQTPVSNDDFSQFGALRNDATSLRSRNATFDGGRLTSSFV